MIAYKKVTRDFRPFILTLEVADSLDVGHGMLRAPIAKVVSAEDMDGQPSEHTCFYSLYDWNFVYKVGENVSADVTRRGGGIYCMPDKESAKKFMSCRASDQI